MRARARAVLGGPGGAAACVLVVLLLTAPRYGPHPDELYVLALEPAWWYPDQPPATVWVAHGLMGVAGWLAQVTGTPVTSWWWLVRCPGAVCAAAGALVAGRIAGSAGGDRRRRSLAAWSYAFTVYPLLVNHLLLTATMDLLAWQLMALAALRVATGHDRAWVWGGVVAGLATWNKLLVVVYAAALGLGVLACARPALRAPAARAGLLVATLLAAVPVGLQLVNGLPMRSVSQDLVVANGTAVRLWLPLLLVALIGPPLAGIWWDALSSLWTTGAPARRGVRVLAVAALSVLAWNVAVPAQPYYAAAAFTPLVAAGWGLMADAGRRRNGLLPGGARLTVAANAVVAVLVCLPVLPGAAAARLGVVNPLVNDQQGWDEAVQSLARMISTAGGPASVTDASPSSTGARPDTGTHHTTDDRDDRVLLPRPVPVVADHYSLAGAVDLFGARLGMTSAGSGHNGLWGQGPPSVTTVVLVGPRAASEAALFRTCSPLGTLDVQGSARASGPALVCHDPRGGWSQAWPRLRWLGG